jgi:hypothetical protein
MGEQMRSVLDRDVPDYKRPLPEPKIDYNIPIERKPEPTNVTFLLSGLAATDDESQIRKKCRGVHIVEIKPEINRISGACLGTAFVTIRGEGVESFRLNMAYSGWEVQEHKPEIGKRHEISSSEKWWTTEAKHKTNEDLDA